MKILYNPYSRVLIKYRTARLADATRNLHTKSYTHTHTEPKHLRAKLVHTPIYFLSFCIFLQSVGTVELNKKLTHLLYNICELKNVS